MESYIATLRLCNVLRILSKNSLGIYVIHCVVFKISHIGIILDVELCQDVIAFLIAILLTAIISCFMFYLRKNNIIAFLTLGEKIE